MDKKEIEKIVDYILKNILVHIIYMVNTGKNVTNLIYVGDDGEIDDDIILCLEDDLSEMMRCDVHILDIREFSVSDRMDVVQRADMIYSGDKFLRKMFEIDVSASYKALIEDHSRYMERKKECLTYYVQ